MVLINRENTTSYESSTANLPVYLLFHIN